MISSYARTNECDSTFELFTLLLDIVVKLFLQLVYRCYDCVVIWI